MQLINAPAGAASSKRSRKPNPSKEARTAIRDASSDAIRKANAILQTDPGNPNSLTALVIAHGVERDYLALIDKSYRQSWQNARKAMDSALRLTQLHPAVQDAWFTIGFSDYLVSAAPFLVRPFMKMEGADGNRPRAISNLERAAASGRYLRPFAKMLLVDIYRQDGRKEDAARTLRELGFQQTGTFKNATDRGSSYPLMVYKNNFKLAFLNYTYGTNGVPTDAPTIVNLIDTVQMRKDLDEARATVNESMQRIHKGDFRAGLELLKPYALVPEAEIEVAIQQTVAQLPLISGRYGRSLGFEVLKEEKAGPYLHRITVLQRYERHVLRWRFLLYRRDTAWALNTFSFDDKVHELFTP